MAGRGARILQEHSPPHPLSQNDLSEPPSCWPCSHSTQLQAQGKRTSGSRVGELLLQFWRSCLTGPSGPFAFFISVLMLEKLARSRVVFMKLLGLGLYPNLKSARGDNVSLITSQSQIGKTWICGHIGLANISTPQLNTSTGAKERRAALSFFPQTQGSGESPSSSDRLRGREVPRRRVMRLEKWCFPSQLSALPTENTLESPDLCGERPCKAAQVPSVMYGPESRGIFLAWAKKPSLTRNP